VVVTPMDTPSVLEELSGVRERPKIILMPTMTRPQQQAQPYSVDCVGEM